jgi:hypothetical protein
MTGEPHIVTLASFGRCFANNSASTASPAARVAQVSYPRGGRLAMVVPCRDSVTLGETQWIAIRRRPMNAGKSRESALAKYCNGRQRTRPFETFGRVRKNPTPFYRGRLRSAFIASRLEGRCSIRAELRARVGGSVSAASPSRLGLFHRGEQAGAVNPCSNACKYVLVWERFA